MIIKCPECHARYKIDPSRTSKKVARIKCPKCAHIFEVSVEGPSEPEAGPAVEKILVVDDSKFFRELIVDVLKPLSFDVHTAADGFEALDFIRRERPRLVILDLNLPQKNGYELIREVRADAAIGDVRLLAMSGVFRKETDVAEVTRAGADGFINKSFKPDQLQQRVSELLRG
jgi:predicted Zn finger-like uncharacterized protein